MEELVVERHVAAVKLELGGVGCRLKALRVLASLETSAGPEESVCAGSSRLCCCCCCPSCCHLCGERTIDALRLHCPCPPLAANLELEAGD